MACSAKKSVNDTESGTNRALAFFVSLIDWSKWNKSKKIFFYINLAVGLCICAVFHLIEATSWGEKTLNPVFDEMTQRETSGVLEKWEECLKSRPGSECDRAIGWADGRIVYIDINHTTFKLWHEPLIIPRAKIARFINLAEGNKARMVILDILTDYPSLDKNDDSALRRTLEGLTNKKSPLIVVFPIAVSLVDNMVRPSVFDDLIARNPNFHRAIPHVAFSTADRVVRYMQHFMVITKRDGSKDILFGIPLLAALLMKNDSEKLALLKEEIIADSRVRDKQDESGNKIHRSYEIKGENSGSLYIENSGLITNRIRFTQIPPGVMNKEGNLFRERLLPDEVESLQSELHGKAVIIGVSSPDKGDILATPVGEMPGMYIIGNAVSTIAGGGQVRPAPLWMMLLLEFMVILLAALLFVHTKSPFVEITISVLIVTVLIPVTYIFYMKYSVFINVAFPIVAMSLQSFITTLHEKVLKAASTVKKRPAKENKGD
jgi:CHASE2 domain-containing sensor protein